MCAIVYLMKLNNQSIWNGWVKVSYNNAETNYLDVELNIFNNESSHTTRLIRLYNPDLTQTNFSISSFSHLILTLKYFWTTSNIRFDFSAISWVHLSTLRSSFLLLQIYTACSFTLGKSFLHFSPFYAHFTKKVMKIRNDPLLQRIYFVLMITTANWLVGLLFMLKSTTLFQLEHLKSRSGRSADFAYKLRIHCLTKILNNWFELFDRPGLWCSWPLQTCI